MRPPALARSGPLALCLTPQILTHTGLGIAKQVVAHGGKVVIGGRRQEMLDKAVNEELGGPSSALGVPTDVRDATKCQALIDAAVKRFGKLDVLVNNAAGNFSSTLEQLSENGFKTVMEIDLFGSFNMAKAALPELKKTQGLIINITATLYYKANPFQFHASAAKAGIDVLTNSAGVEWGADYGVRAVSIVPGPIEKTVGGPDGRVFGRSKELPTERRDIAKMVPVGRFGTVDDIAYCALFVASDAGSWINATQVVVDGGHWHESSAKFLAGKKFIEKKSANERQEYKGGVKVGSKL